MYQIENGYTMVVRLCEKALKGGEINESPSFTGMKTGKSSILLMNQDIVSEIKN